MRLTDERQQVIQQWINEDMEEADRSHGVVVVDWLLLAASSGVDEDGDEITQYSVLEPDCSPHRSMGLLSWADGHFRDRLWGCGE